MNLKGLVVSGVASGVPVSTLGRVERNMGGRRSSKRAPVHRSQAVAYGRLLHDNDPCPYHHMLSLDMWGDISCPKAMTYTRNILCCTSVFLWYITSTRVATTTPFGASTQPNSYYSSIVRLKRRENGAV